MGRALSWPTPCERFFCLSPPSCPASVAETPPTRDGREQKPAAAPDSGEGDKRTNEQRTPIPIGGSLGGGLAVGMGA
eukprot:1697135-Pyramimonas_sp.AAC.1